MGGDEPAQACPGFPVPLPGAQPRRQIPRGKIPEGVEMTRQTIGMLMVVVPMAMSTIMLVSAANALMFAEDWRHALGALALDLCLIVGALLWTGVL